MFGDSKYPIYSSNEFSYLNISGRKGQVAPLVFLHGMFGGPSNFDPLLQRVEGYTVYVPRIPLFLMNGGQLTIPALAGWLQRFMSECGIERPVLLGNSLGGHIALEHALQQPNELAGLVLTGSSGLFENQLGSSCPKRNDRDYIRRQAARTFYKDLVDDRLVDEIMEITQSPSRLEKLLKIARSAHAHNLKEELQNITAPALLVWGRDDEVTPPEVAEQFLEGLPDARLRWIDCCGHAPMMEHPDAFAACLTDFMEELKTINPNTNHSIHYEKNYTH